MKRAILSQPVPSGCHPAPSPPLFFHHAAQLLTLAGPPVPRRGKDLAELGIIEDGAVVIEGGRLAAVGRTADLEPRARHTGSAPGIREINCSGLAVMPGFVDSHTHLVFAGSRVDDFVERLRGRTYEEIAAAGGGIHLTARRVSGTSETDLERRAAGFLEEFAAHGTTTLEAKSGYGLDPANEFKLLRVMRRLAENAPVEIAGTLLAAHALPQEYQGRAEEYINQIADQLIPAAARDRLSEFIDCFCDRGAFTVDECRRLLRAGQRHGLVPRLHAEQLAPTGAARLAVELGAASADHLDRIDDAGIDAVAGSNTIATLLPGVNFFLGLKQYPPARRLIEAGAAVALATDFNPGSCPTLNLQLVMSVASTAMRMSPAEAIAAATINGACALGRASRLGSLEPGKQADLVVMDVDDYREIPYYFGVNHCVMTVKAGRIIYQDRRFGPPAARYSDASS